MAPRGIECRLLLISLDPDRRREGTADAGFWEPSLGSAKYESTGVFRGTGGVGCDIGLGLFSCEYTDSVDGDEMAV